MKVLITYSSLTGNTKLVAEAIAEACTHQVEICPIKEAREKTPTELDQFGCIAIGYWVDKGIADAKAKSFIELLDGKKIAFFGTLGAYPDSDHAKDCIVKTEELALGNEILGHFLCQGKIDPKILEMMAKHASAAHPMTEERKLRIEEAKKHPNQDDLDAAKEVFTNIFKDLV